MIKYAFMSCNQKDTDAARALQEILNGKDVVVNRLPLGLMNSEGYTRFIYRAIGNCSCFIFLFSKNSQDSGPEIRELEAAVSCGRRIMVIRLDNTEPSDNFRLYINKENSVMLYGFEPNRPTVRHIVAWASACIRNFGNEEYTIKMPRPPMRSFDDGENHCYGNFLPDEVTGKGVYAAKNGERYVGSFVKGNFHGQGKLTYANGSIYKGEFTDGEQTGYGELLSACQDLYEGEFLCGECHGVGKLQDKNGNCYIGDFEEGIINGQVECFYANGDRYIGGMKDSLYYGWGEIFYSDGRRFAGSFVDGTKYSGYLYAPDGSVISQI